MINAAIVGLGRWGRNLVEAVQGKSDRLCFTHAVVRRPDAASDFTARHGLRVSTDYDRVLADAGVQAVVLATPHSLHARQIVAAARAGKPVFCEKPLALGVADAEQAIAACRRANVPLGLGYNKRFWPSMRELKGIVQSGALGDLLHIEGHFSNESTRKFYTGWRERPDEAPGGGLTATGVHVLDAFVDLAGPVRRVRAEQISRESASEPVDTLTVLVQFANGASGVMCGVRSTPQYWRVHAFGTNGSAEALEDTDVIVRLSGASPKRLTFEAADALRLELEAFADAIGGGAPYPITHDQMLDGVAALEATIRSLERNDAVIVPGSRSHHPAR